MSADVLYVGIENPGEVRKSLLECSRDLVILMQKNEKVKSIRLQKQEKIDLLKNQYHELIALITELKNELPAIEPNQLPKHKERHNEPKSSNKPAPMPKKKMSSVDRLESELSRIEEKLKTLV